MNRQLIVLLTILGLILAFYAFNQYIYDEKQADPLNLSNEPTNRDSTGIDEPLSMVQVIPISHATAILKWDSAIIYTDPTGGAMAFREQPEADIILITDIHGDHYSPETLMSVEVSTDATLIAPQAVIDMMPPDLKERAQALANDETTTVLDFDITGIPMYNLPESADARHTKGRGNGYVIQRGNFRAYIAGDTSATPEMLALEDIDLALVPMNPPLTMTVEEAARAVLDFKPRQVYPFHYRTQDGLSDVDKFKAMVNAGDPDIDVVLLDWYPQENQ